MSLKDLLDLEHALTCIANLPMADAAARLHKLRLSVSAEVLKARRATYVAL